jgi:NADPH2:quinone reductase
LLVRVTAAGVTPLDHTILSGGLPRTKPPLVLGNEGIGVIEDAGDSGFAVGSHVMFTRSSRCSRATFRRRRSATYWTS